MDNEQEVRGHTHAEGTAEHLVQRTPTGGHPKDFCVCGHHEMNHANYLDLPRACNQNGCECREYAAEHPATVTSGPHSTQAVAYIAEFPEAPAPEPSRVSDERLGRIIESATRLIECEKTFYSFDGRLLPLSVRELRSKAHAEFYTMIEPELAANMARELLSLRAHSCADVLLAKYLADPEWAARFKAEEAQP